MVYGREKSNLHSRIIVKVRFSTFKYKTETGKDRPFNCQNRTGKDRPFNCQNRANLVLRVVSKVVLYFLNFSKKF
jgi:hypothetical protein